MTRYQLTCWYEEGQVLITVHASRDAAWDAFKAQYYGREQPKPVCAIVGPYRPLPGVKLAASVLHILAGQGRRARASIEHSIHKEKHDA